MNVEELTPAVRSTFYFIGVTTSKSSIMRVFPKWARYLGLGEVEMKGIDCALHDDPEVYRRIVSFIKIRPLSKGALVTTHKLELGRDTDMIEYLDTYARCWGRFRAFQARVTLRATRKTR